MKINPFIGLFIFCSALASAQVSDSFTDGDFTYNPIWTGSTNQFIINSSQQLQLNNSAAGNSYLTTPSNASSLNNFEWQVYVKQGFAPSSSNYGRVYLVSDQANLVGTLNGYYLQFGEAGSSDAIELFKQAGSTSTSICRATNGLIANSFSVRIRVTRDNLGVWNMYTDYTGGNNFVLEATGTDAAFNTSNAIGVVCVYTVSNATKFYYDDFYAGPIQVDTTPPTVISVNATSSTQVSVLFSEKINQPTAESISNYTVDNGIGIPLSATLQPDGKTVLLLFNGFTNGYKNNLTISGVKDLVGNVMISTNFSFTYFNAIAPNKYDIIVSEVFPDPDPIVGLPAAEFIEIYNRSVNPFDLSGWKLTDGTSTATLTSQIILPNSYWVVTSSSNAALFSTYQNVIGVSSFPSLNNSGDLVLLKCNTGLTVDSLNYSTSWYRDADKQQGGWSLERIDLNKSSTDASNWVASQDATGGTPGKQNSWYGKNPDVTPPKLVSLTVKSDSQLELVFDEPLDVNTVINSTFYADNSIGNPTSSQVLADQKTVELTFNLKFQNGMTNHLTISNLTDVVGNEIISITSNFYYLITVQPNKYDIIVSEVFPDPDPIVGLPAAEFIEIYNRGTNPFDLSGWKLTDGTSTATFASQIILPNSYWVVTSSSNAALFSAYQNVIGVSSFPSLNNSGDLVLLKSNTGLTVDSLNYLTSWYRDADKQQGGWSLERIDLNKSSTDALNWVASQDATGGTPGKQNSWYGKNPDVTPPKLVSLTVKSDSQLELIFDEPLDVNTVNNSTFYADNSIGNPTSTQLLADQKTVELTFNTNFQNGIENSLTLNSISDLVGNKSALLVQPFTYIIYIGAIKKDVILTEIMADPTPAIGLPEVEFVEIYNRSESPFNLAGWSFLAGSSKAIFNDQIILPKNYLIVTNSKYVSKFSGYSNVVGLTSFPILPNEGTSLIIRNDVGLTIDSLNYSIAWYRDNDKAEGGYSLELIDPNNPCGEEDNWIASESAAGGTPGKQNSVYASKPDLTGPKFIAVEPLGNNQLLLTFDEKLNDNSLHIENVNINPQAQISTIKFTDVSKRQVSVLLSTLLETRMLYTLTLSNIVDCAGNEIQMGFNKLSFALPENVSANDILINELLFNPKPNGVDFIEIYNQSAKYISVSELKLANLDNGVLTNIKPVTSSTPVFQPNSYLVFTTDPGVLTNNYPAGFANNFITTSLPSLPDDAGSLAIIGNSGIIIDSILYSKSWHSAFIKDDAGVSLERISFGASTNNPINWKSASAQSGFATPGYINSNARPDQPFLDDKIKIEPEVFAPNSGYQDFAKINYAFDQNNFTANIKVLDQQGRTIKTIANNETLGYSGYFRWDGNQEDGTKARMGYYIIWIDLFDDTGAVNTLRKRVIVAGR